MHVSLLTSVLLSCKLQGDASFHSDAQTQHDALANYAQVLKHLGPGAIITHEVSAQTAGNVIGQRDFLSVRHGCKHDSSLYLCGAAIQLESFPPRAGFVR